MLKTALLVNGVNGLVETVDSSLTVQNPLIQCSSICFFHVLAAKSVAQAC